MKIPAFRMEATAKRDGAVYTVLLKVHRGARWEVCGILTLQASEWFAMSAVFREQFEVITDGEIPSEAVPPTEAG